MPGIFPMMTTESGQSMAFPDTCMTPGVSAGAPGPLPYPNIAMMTDGSGASKVKVRNKAPLRKGDSIRMSTGDEAGNSPGGVVSGCFKGACSVKLGSMNVKIEGKEVGYLTVMVAHNGSNANMPAGTHIVPSQTAVLVK
jgi:uncharacterized Zn-binding protein involved in type VI secretion